MDQGLSFGWLFLKTVLAMVIVIALAFFVLRYLLPKLYFRGQGSSGRRIQILERINIEPRKALWIVQVGNHRALVGTSEQGMQKIFDLEDDDVC